MRFGGTYGWSWWKRWAAGERPSDVLRGLEAAGELDRFPELAALPNVPQDPRWHPEGDVWVHTLLVCDEAAEIGRRERLDETAREELLFAALCHDLGKPATTVWKDGRWTAPGHPQAGVEPARDLLKRMEAPESLVAVVLPLVAEHLAHAAPRIGKRAIRRVLMRLRPAPWSRLMQLIEADLGGRPPLPRGLSPDVERFAERASALLESGLPTTSAPTEPPLVRGRHLIELGHEPGAWFGPVLDECHAAQLRGEFQDEAAGLRYLAERLAARRAHESA